MEFNYEMAVVLGVIAATLVLFAKEILSPDLVALFAVVTLMVLGIAKPSTALAGFSNPAVHTIAAMFAISAGIIRTGIVERFGHQLIRLGGESPTRVFFLTLITVVVLSAFVNNTPVVVVFMPIVLSICRRKEWMASRFLIPLSYAAIAGGTLTIVGTSTNLIAAEVMKDHGYEPFSMFEITKLGVVLVALVLVYMVTLGPRVLPDRVTLASLIDSDQSREFITRAVVSRDSPLVGNSFVDTGLAKMRKVRVLEVLRLLELGSMRLV